MPISSVLCCYLGSFDYIWGLLLLAHIKLRVTFHRLFRPAFVDEISINTVSSETSLINGNLFWDAETW